MKKKLIFAVGSKILLSALLCLPALALRAAEIVLIPAGIDVPGGSPGWRYKVAAAEASTPIPAWRTNTFAEDGTWSTGALPLGFTTGANDPNGYEAKLVTTVPTATTGVFLRKTFVVTNRAALSEVRLGVMVDDGMVAWINGREIMRFQCCTGGTDPAVPTFNSLALTANDSTTNSVTLVADATGPLIDGTNVLTIQLFNANSTSSDLVLDATLVATLDDVPPTVAGQSPAPNSTVQQLTAIQVNFSEPVANVDASDLLINGLAATNLLGISPSIYTFEFAQPATGVVNVAFAPAHGIVDLASPANPFAGASWTITLNTNIQLAQFFITEFMADNSGRGTNGIRDEDGDSSDWIEIYNSQSSIGSIGGWFLTDATNNLTKWRIPAGATVPARGYLLVFASSKNRTNNLARLHANFSLNNGGEYLALVDPQTNIISEFYPTYPPQVEDVSYGRDRVTPSTVGYFGIPTPGSNNVAGTDQGLEVQFSRPGGTYVSSFPLVLSTRSNAVIRYTIVNTAQNIVTATNIPTANSTLYTGPITVAGTMQVRARAFPTGAGQFAGPPRTESYVQVDAGISNFVSTLPIVVIHTVANAPLSGGYPTPDNSVIIAAFDNDTPTGMSSIMAPPQVVKRAGINLRGSSTQGFPKSSFAVEFLDEFNQDEENEFLGLPKESDWVLYAPNQFDLSMMHNPFMHQIGRDFGYYSSRTRFVEVFFKNGSGAITANTNLTGANMGDYNGIYVLEEKVKRDGNRLDIEPLNPEHTSPSTITGGYLLKIDRTDGNERTFNGGGVTINYQDPDGLEMVTPARAAQANYITTYFNNFNAGLTGNSLTNVAGPNHYSKLMDVDATIDLHIANVLVMNVDGYRLSGYIYKDRGGKLVFGPLWDTDRGMGTSRGDQRSYNPRSWQSYDASSCGGTDYGTDFFQGSTTPAWVGRWFSDVDFWQRWVDRYQHWRTSVLDTNRVGSVIDGFAQQVREAQVREQKRWSGSGASDTSPRVGNIANCTGIFTHNFPGTYQGEVDFQKRWLNEHIHFMDTNLLNRPTLTRPEGQVPLGTVVALVENSGKPGTIIYYTLDGSDPRGFQGATNPAAIRYTGPITITNNVRIHARALNPNHRNLTGLTVSGSRNPVLSTPWSGNVAATYFITPPSLVITELMYHPAEPASQSDTNDADNFEFIELKNIGSTTLNLAGFRFTNGVDFTFSAASGVTMLEPGGYVLIVKNIGSFTNRYGVRTNIAGAFDGNLNNAGERITLVGPRDEPILDFVYSDSWHPLSDGFGFSLVVNNENAPLSAWDTQQGWRNSSFENGSPGLVEPAPPLLPVIYISEALTHTDLPAVDVIELHNPGTTAADISGWYLTDDSTEPKKYLIPAGTIIPAGGFVQFNETDHFNAAPGGFALGSDGDELYLFSASGGLLTGYAHGFSFGASQNGATFGRYVTSQGEQHFVAQATNTLGASNSLPLVGPIVISEIMYHPPDTMAGGNAVDNSTDEFIELYNITGTNVALFNTLNPSNTWHLTSGADFTFPTNVSLAPMSFALVVNFNPATNASQLAAFRAKYGVSASIPIFGPYEGKLDNSTESVRLSRPDNLNTNGTVPYILVDRVDYQDSGAWPVAADGLGTSLQRLVLSAYGNDPTNWTAVRATAGAPRQGGTPPTITQQPSDVAAFRTSNATFTVGVSGANVGVQWRLNGVAIAGATNTSLTVANVQYDDAGYYDVMAFNGGGVVFSSNALLTVLTPLAFIVEPVNQHVLPGTNVTLVAAAIGTEPLRYQWRFEGEDIAGATNETYSFTGASLANHGNYQVVVTDPFSTIVSTNAFIFVRIPPVIVIPPVSQFVVQGGNAYFSVYATGAPPIRYRWIRSGQPYTTNTTGLLILTNVQASIINGIRVNVVNDAPGSVNSTAVSLIMHPDFDGDRVGDPWETQYGFNTNNVDDGALDFDGDGMSNHDEYVAGTDPTNVLSVLKLLQTGPNNNVLQFTAETNKLYTVQCRTNLTTAPWSNLTNIWATTQVRTIQITVPNPAPQPERYYRVATPPVP